jgi:hypothetical protein
MKYIFVFAIFFAVFCIDSIDAQENVTLNNALKNTSEYFSGRIPRGSKVVILNFRSNHEALAEYIIDELTMHLVNTTN